MVALRTFQVSAKSFDRGPALPGSRLSSMRAAAANLAGQLIFALAQIDDVSQQTVRRPLDVADLNDHLRAHPMHPRQHQR